MKLIEKIITTNNIKIKVLEMVAIKFDFEELSLAYAIVSDRKTGKCYIFGSSTLVEDGEQCYYEAFEYDLNTKMQKADFVKICEVYIKEEFLGYTYGDEKIMLI